MQPSRPISKLLIAIVTLLVVAITVSKPLAHGLTELWWFASLDLTQVFWTTLSWELLLWLVTFGIYTCFLWVNYRIALHETRHQPWRWLDDHSLEEVAEHLIQIGVIASILVISAIAASTTAPHWQILLQALNATPMGQTDPILGQDISVYLFQLPLYDAFFRWLLGLGVTGFFISSLVYLLKGAIATQESGWRVEVRGLAKFHLSALLGGLFAIGAWGFWLARYHLLDSRRGLIFGVGYTDHYARLPAYSILSILTAIVAIFWFVSLHRRKLTLPLRGVIGLAISVFILLTVYP
ncbi:MAG: UPF0182 family protein, partial [Synechococcales bacterium]|nr:UPF0182 family protein [Synechococcales bacterium]